MWDNTRHRNISTPRNEIIQATDSPRSIKELRAEYKRVGCIVLGSNQIPFPDGMCELIDRIIRETNPKTNSTRDRGCLKKDILGGHRGYYSSPFGVQLLKHTEHQDLLNFLGNITGINVNGHVGAVVNSYLAAKKMRLEEHKDSDPATPNRHAHPIVCTLINSGDYSGKPVLHVRCKNTGKAIPVVCSKDQWVVLDGFTSHYVATVDEDRKSIAIIFKPESSYSFWAARETSKVNKFFNLRINKAEIFEGR